MEAGERSDARSQSAGHTTGAFAISSGAQFILRRRDVLRTSTAVAWEACGGGASALTRAQQEAQARKHRAAKDAHFPVDPPAAHLSAVVAAKQRSVIRGAPCA